MGHGYQSAMQAAASQTVKGDTPRWRKRPLPSFGHAKGPHICLWNAIHLVTDHKPLEVIYGPHSKPCARIERRVICLQPYDFWVMYAPGQSNVADPLSCLLSQNKATNRQHGAEEYVRFAAISATPVALKPRKKLKKHLQCMKS